ncbi:SLC13 family permease [Turicibacter bilis]
MILNTKKRTATALLGAGTLLLIGTLTSSFDVAKAFTSFPSEIIILLIVLSLFTDIFERCGVMNRISYKFLSSSRKEVKLLLFSFCPSLFSLVPYL